MWSAWSSGVARHAIARQGRQPFQDVIPCRTGSGRVGQLVEPRVDSSSELQIGRWQLLLEPRIYGRLHARCPSGLLDHDQIPGNEPVHDPVERLQHRPHLGENRIAPCRRKTNSLARVTRARSRRRSRLRVRCQKRWTERRRGRDDDERDETNDELYPHGHVRAHRRRSGCGDGRRGRPKPPPLTHLKRVF